MAWTSDSTGRWAKDWVGWSGFNRFFSQLVSWTFPGEETGGIEATFETTGNDDRAARRERRAGRLAARLLLDAAPASSGRTSSRVTVNLVQVAPGVYDGTARRARRRAPMPSGSPRREPGTSPLGRTVGLVAPTSAEYRQLGANEPFLGSLRSATGGARGDGRRPTRGSTT